PPDRHGCRWPRVPRPGRPAETSWWIREFRILRPAAPAVRRHGTARPAPARRTTPPNISPARDAVRRAARSAAPDRHDPATGWGSPARAYADRAPRAGNR